MTNAALIAEYNSTVKEAEELEAKLQDTVAELTMIRASLRAMVSFNKKGQTYEFHHQGRVVKAKPNSYNRYKIWEGKKIIHSDSMKTLQQIRLDIALGRI